MGELAHQNIESVRVLDPGLVVFGAFLLELEHETSNGAISASAKYFSSFRACVLCLFLKAAGPLLFFRRRVAFDVHVFPFKQELHHLLLKQFAVLRVHHAELFLVDQHGLLVLPLRPCFFGDFVVNTLSELARIQLEIPAVRFTLQEGTKMVLLIINPL